MRCTRCTRYTGCTRYMYKMYETYEMYKMCAKCMKGMRKYKTDERYPSQYGFQNGAKSRQLAGDLSPWCDSRNIGEPALAVWPCWKLNSTLSRLVSPLIPLTHDDLAYDRANSSALQATTSCGAHGRGFFISTQLLLAFCLLTYVVADLYGRSSGGLSICWKYLPLWYLSADRPLVEVWGFIILERHLVARSDRSIGRNQTSSLVKSSASSLVLVRVYWLDDEGPPSCSSVKVRVYWLDDKGLTPASHQY